MKKGKIAAFIGVFVLVALTVVVINSQRQSKLPDIKTVKVTKGDIQTILSTNALLQSKKIKNYSGSPQLAVEKVYVKVGDPVKAGDVLLTYDIAELLMSEKQARIQYDNALLNKKELLNQKDLLEKEIIDLDEQITALEGSNNPQDLANIQSLKQRRKSIQTISPEKIKLMDNAVAMAQLSLDAATNRVNKVKDGLKAEFEGVVTASNAVEGLPLSMAQPAFTVQQLDNLKGVVRLGKYDAAKIGLGQKVTLKSGSTTYQGTVSFIEPAASKDMGMAADTALRAEIDIINPDDQLKVDFDVNADILVGEVKDVLKLPIECIQFNQDDTSVFKVENGIATLVSVKLGLQSDTEVEITEGLSEGQVVISNPSIEIKSGMVVTKEGKNR